MEFVLCSALCLILGGSVFESTVTEDIPRCYALFRVLGTPFLLEFVLEQIFDLGLREYRERGLGS